MAQTGEIAKAASAAYTYFLLNPENKDTITNLQLYRGKMGVNDEDITDMARKPVPGRFICILYHILWHTNHIR